LSTGAYLTVPNRTETGTLGLVAAREPLLRALADGPVSKATLTERVAVSRSTVDRGLRRLAEHGLAEPTPDGYRRTVLGRLLLAEYDRYTDRAGSILDASEVLAARPAGVDLPSSILVDAVVASPQPNDPYGPLEDGMARLASAEHVRSVTTPALARYAGLFDLGLLPDEGSAELCLPTASVESLVADRPDWFEEAVARPDVELREATAEPPFTVAVVHHDGDRSVVVAVFDYRGVGSGLVNYSDSAVAWAETFVEQWWVEATVVSPSEC
jgi:DNA-binding transcriptional ArsR family regulator